MLYDTNFPRKALAKIDKAILSEYDITLVKYPTIRPILFNKYFIRSFPAKSDYIDIVFFSETIKNPI